MSQYPFGSTKDELDTPCLCVDLDLMEKNILDLAQYCKERNVQWRPHSKCHKIPAIAHREVEAGAVGVTCAKVGEAEVMAAGGIRDILIANQIVGAKKIARVVSLCHSADIIVTVDHIDQAVPLANAADQAGVTPRVIIEIDIGLSRAGVLPGEPTIELARKLSELQGIRFAGVMAYEGHLLTIENPDEKRNLIFTAMQTVLDTKNALESAGLTCEIVSVGGTGSYHITADCPGITELQAGGGIFMDPFYRDVCQVPGLEFALTVLTTVTSRPTLSRANIDAGRKSVNTDLALPLIQGREDISVEFFSAEHGTLKLEPSAEHLAMGDQLELIVGYGDLTTCLHDEMYGFRKGRLEVVWPILGRGKIR